MKKSMFFLAMTALLLTMQSARADGFQGLYFGAKLGESSSRFSGTAVVSSNSESFVNLNERLAPSTGLEIGFNSASGNLVVGLDGFVDFNASVAHAVRVNGAPAYMETIYGSTVYGADLKLGVVSGYWMPYLKLGYGSGRADGDLTGEGSGAHFGLGAEYKFSPRMGMAGELSDFTAKSDGGTLHNTNFTFNLNFYLE